MKQPGMQLPRTWGLSGVGFSLWILVLARTNPHRLKPAPLELERQNQMIKTRRGVQKQSA